MLRVISRVVNSALPEVVSKLSAIQFPFTLTSNFYLFSTSPHSLLIASSYSLLLLNPARIILILISYQRIVFPQRMPLPLRSHINSSQIRVSFKHNPYHIECLSLSEISSSPYRGDDWDAFTLFNPDLKPDTILVL